MHAVELSPETDARRPRNTAHETTGRDAAAGARKAPKLGDVIDAWARHAGASNGFGDAVIGDGRRAYVLPHWKSR